MLGSIWNGIKNFGSNVIEYGVDFVKGKGCPLHSQTYKTRDYYENLVKERKIV